MVASQRVRARRSLNSRAASGAGARRQGAGSVTSPMLKKHEYHTRTQLLFAFNYDEPATVPTDESTIRKLDDTFRAPGLGYKLVDYSVLAVNGVAGEPVD
jgi:hypothetical protein